MPAPNVIVVFQDDDGDEFPIASSLWAPGFPQREIAAAQKVAARAIEEGGLSPNGELRYLRTERINSSAESDSGKAAA